MVDDAIVVVEAVQRHIDEGMTPHDAALKAMEEVSTPVIAIALILASVFIPTAFIPGISGRLFQQFALTIALSVVLSAFNALTLSPALAAKLLRPREKGRGLIGRLFGGFNRVFTAATDGYIRISGLLIRRSALVLLLLALVSVSAFLVARRVPSTFLPQEDQGYAFVAMQLPNAASLAALRRRGAQDRRDHEAHARRAGVHERGRIQLVQPGAGNLQQLLLRHAQALGKAADGRRDSSNN